MKLKLLGIVIAIVFIGIFSSIYIVDETEQVVITQFGKAIGQPITEPGLYFKIPVVQHATYFPKNLLNWDGEPGQIPTLDKTYIGVDTFALWKIVDPLRFFQTANNVTGAQARLDDILDAAVRNLITSYPLIETVRTSNRKLGSLSVQVDQQRIGGSLGNVTTGRNKITRAMLKQAQPKVAEFGIKLVDIKIKRLNYVESVRKSVYGRMIAERKQIAEKFRSEGKGEAKKIEGDQDKDLKRITSEAYKTAQEIKGKADAKSTLVYARAYGKDPEFYSFVKSLETYEKGLDKDAYLLLSTDSEFFKYLKGYSGKP
ncbi:MAG TPA: protease modulator HflC [Desulfobacterales bacterium]|jgi:membrane protease subunit HflC|nr:protease modulator HflC [Desulfobacterales bacterium]